MRRTACFRIHAGCLMIHAPEFKFLLRTLCIMIQAWCLHPTYFRIYTRLGIPASLFRIHAAFVMITPFGLGLMLRAAWVIL